MNNINKKLVPMKAHYFLFNTATGPLVTFLPTIAKQLGFLESVVGRMYAIFSIAGLISKPLFGILADKFQLHKVFFLAFQAILAIAFFTIYFIPTTLHQEYANVTLACHHNYAFLEVCSSNGFTEEILNPVLRSNITNASCQLSCLGSPKIYEEVCHGWNITNYCGSGNSSDAIDLKFNVTAHFNMKENLYLKSCLEIPIQNVSYKENSENHPLFCNTRLHTTCIMTCPRLPSMDGILHEVPRETEHHETSTIQVHIFLWAATISYIGMAVVVCITDAICIDLLCDQQGSEYGKQKMYGSIGFGISNIGAGFLVDFFSRGQLNKDYTCIFYMMLITMILDMVVSSSLKKKSVRPVELSILWELGTIAKEGRVLVFAFWCIGAGICTGVVWNFLFWYIEDLVTANERYWVKILQGSLTGVQCFLGELPFNFLSGWILKKLGHINVMSLVLLVYAVRFMIYSLISYSWLFIFAELLHGPTFGLSWPTMVAYGDKIAPSGTRAAMQGFVGAVFEGLGVSFGSLIGGYMMQFYGGKVMFRAFSVGALIWLSIFWILQLILRKVKAYPIQQGHNHLASYATPNDAILMTTSQELETY